MQTPLQFCPRCKKDVAFVAAAGARTCPECGFQYAVSERPNPGSFPDRPDRAGNPWLQFLTIAGIVVLALLGAGALLLGILFVGCALAFRG